MFRRPFFVAFALLAAACSARGDDETTASSAEVHAAGIDGDRLFAEAAKELGRTRGSSFRYALDRATSAAAGLNVEPYPDGSCSGRPEQLYWNQEDDSLYRLGMIGVADAIALEAVSANGYADYHTARLLSIAGGTDADAMKALEILRQTESPAMMLSAVQALTRNPYPSDDAFRALLVHEIDLYETKVFRGEDGRLRMPDLAHPPTQTELVAKLRGSSVLSYRLVAIDQFARGRAIAASDADAFLEDAQLEVRSEAGKIFWRGSDTSADRQAALIAWFDSPAGRRLLRKKVLWERYGLTEADATAWAEEPEGYAETYAEIVGAFIGEALRAAPADADIRVLLQAASQLPYLTNIIEDAARAAARAPHIDPAEHVKILLALGKHVDGYEQPTPFAFLWRKLAALAIENGAGPELIERVHRDVYLGDAALQADVEAKLASSDRDTRIEAVRTVASKSVPGFQAALFDVGLADPASIATADAYALDAALDHGASAKAVVDRVLGTAQIAWPDKEPSLALTGPLYLDAFERAIDRVPPPEQHDALVAFGKLISTQTPPGSETYGKYAHILQRLDVAGWKEILVGADGKPRLNLLPATPDDPATKRLVSELVRPVLLRSVSVSSSCSSGSSVQRPGIAIELVPYVVEPTKSGVSLSKLVDDRVATLRADSQSTPELPLGSTAESLIALRPNLRFRYYGGAPYDVDARAVWEKPAQELVEAILHRTSSSPIATDVLVRALGAATDFPSLSESELARVEARLETDVPGSGMARWGFFLRASHGDTYDALAAKFRTTVPSFRWDLADEARPRGEQAALETLLARTGSEFGADDALFLASAVVGRAAVSERFRQGMLELTASSNKFWSSWGNWTEGTLNLARAVGPSLDFVVRTAPLVWSAEGAQNHDIQHETQLFGTIARDPRLSSEAAVRLAWILLSTRDLTQTPTFDDLAFGPTAAIDLVLAIQRRTDVDETEKKALGRALLRAIPQ